MHNVDKRCAYVVLVWMWPLPTPAKTVAQRKQNTCLMARPTGSVDTVQFQAGECL